jgi:voltage-gated potassium channel
MAEAGKQPLAPLTDAEAAAELGTLRHRIHTIIFEANTPAGKAFDVGLIWAILISVSAVVLESVAELRSGFGPVFSALEWFFTVLFTLEYALRLFSLRHPLAYARSFFGLVDLLSFLPTYLALFLPGTQAFAVLRVFRFLRLFRIFKLIRYMREARVLMLALRGGLPKITVFLVALIGIVITMGALMYVVEGEANGFTSMPKAIYWAVITLTTVGYGDLVPKTVLGQTIASAVMIMGYSILAVPTGIVTVEIVQASRKFMQENDCPGCGSAEHDTDATFCKKCGTRLD